MDRILACVALLVALVALLVATLSRRTPPEPAPAPAPAPAASRDDAPRPSAIPAAPASGVTADEVAHAWDRKMAAREEAIVASVWPRVVRELDHRDGPLPAMPKTIDGLLNLLLNNGRPVEEGADLPAEDSVSRRKIVDCKSHLKQLGVYVALYESKHKRNPFTREDMISPDLITDEKLLVCPVDQKSRYIYVYPFLEDATAPDAILMYDEFPHPDGSRCVLYFTGRVNEVKDAEFTQALSAQFAAERDLLSGAIVKAREAAARPEATAKEREDALKRLERLEQVTR